MAITRRWFARILSFLTVSPLLLHADGMPAANELLQSTDGRKWAEAFVRHVQANPAIALDEATMTGWFAGAIMSGWDHADRTASRELNRKMESAGRTYAKLLERQAVAGAVARGWCSPVNEQKVFDGDIATAVTDEVMALRSRF